MPVSVILFGVFILKKLELKVKFRKKRVSIKSISTVLAILSGLMFSANAFAIARHSSSAPTDTPPASVVGRWSTNASFVVVAPSWIITTRHQGGAPSTVETDGVAYNCNYNALWEGGGNQRNADIRLIKLKKADGTYANLNYCSPYTLTDENDKEVVIGGYGVGVVSKLYNYSIHYGYALDTQNGNTIMRWCRNLIEGSGSQTDNYDRESDVIFSFFDGPETSIAVEYEGMPTMYDSGGGWFIQVNSEWKLVALSRAVTIHDSYYECWFKNKTTLLDNPDYFDGVRISSYADWINETIANNTPQIDGDISRNGKVDMVDIAILSNHWKDIANDQNDWAGGSDINQDGFVDELDLVILAQNYLAIVD